MNLVIGFGVSFNNRVGFLNDKREFLIQVVDVGANGSRGEIGVRQQKDFLSDPPDKDRHSNLPLERGIRAVNRDLSRI